MIKDVTVIRIDLEHRFGAQRDISEVTEQRAAMPFFHIRVGAAPFANPIEEIADVVGFAPCPVACSGLFVLHVERDVTCVEDRHAPLGAVEGDPKSGIPGPQR